MLSTADGGQTFTRRTAVPVIPPATDLLCTSDTTCFASSGGSIQRTTDGAVTWTQVAGFSLPLFGLEQADATTLYAVGQALQLLKSTDGGATWEQKAVAGVPGGDFGSIRCSDADNCLLAMRQGNRIVKTTDGGDTFTAAAPPAESAFAVELASATRGLAVGNFGSAVISDDGGDTWRVVGGRLTDDFTVLEGATDRIAYAGGRAGALARTTDAGQTWANVSPPTSLGIRAVAAPTASRLFVLADDGTVQRSDNGGASYRLLNTGTPVGARDLVATDANHVVVIGARGIRRSIDGGETFSAVSDRDLRGAGLLMADTAGSGIVAAGRLRLLFSPNGGLTWRPLRRPTKSRIHDISFVSTQTGYLVDVSFRLWKTTNAGRTWTELVSTGRPMTQVDFADARNGYVVVPRVGLEARGFVLRTSDGGASWRPQLVSPAFVRDVDMAGGTAYALAGTNFLYATTSGGDVGTARALMITTRGRRISKPSHDHRVRPALEGGRRRAGGRFDARLGGVALAGRDRRLERHVRHPLARFQEVRVRRACTWHGRPRRSGHEAARRRRPPAQEEALAGARSGRSATWPAAPPFPGAPGAGKRASCAFAVEPSSIPVRSPTFAGAAWLRVG